MRNLVLVLAVLFLGAGLPDTDEWRWLLWGLAAIGFVAYAVMSIGPVRQRIEPSLGDRVEPLEREGRALQTAVLATKGQGSPDEIESWRDRTLEWGGRADAMVKRHGGDKGVAYRASAYPGIPGDGAWEECVAMYLQNRCLGLSRLLH